MFHFLVGGVSVACFFLLLNFARERQLNVTLWQWILTGLGILYSAFVVELIYGFVAEGEPKAALVMGLLVGIVAIIWVVLIGRNVFLPKKS